MRVFLVSPGGIRVMVGRTHTSGAALRIFKEILGENTRCVNGCFYFSTDSDFFGYTTDEPIAAEMYPFFAATSDGSAIYISSYEDFLDNEGRLMNGKD